LEDIAGSDLLDNWIKEKLWRARLRVVRCRTETSGFIYLFFNILLTVHLNIFIY